VQADANSSFTVPVMLKLASSDVGFNRRWRCAMGKDVIVQQMITNRRATERLHRLRDLPRPSAQERLVTNLAPGRTTIKKYRFSEVKFAPEAKVRSGVKEWWGHGFSMMRSPSNELTQ
jgi:hypothetical protein